MNIFAQELEEILKAHNKDLGSLFSLRIPDPRLGIERPIPPSKVVRLKRSLERDITATLNSEELETLQAWAPLDPDGQELRRLRAALVAEGVRHLLAGRIRAEQAYHLGKLTLQSLLDDQAQSVDLWRETLLETVRHFSFEEFDDDGFDDTVVVRSTAVFEQEADTALEPPGEDSPGARALEPVAEVCEQGALWLTIAADTPDLLARAGFVAMATSLLERARDMARNAPSVALNTPAQAEWLAIIAAALAEADVLR